MKIIRYEVVGTVIVAVFKEDGTYENVEQPVVLGVERPYSQENEKLAEKEAYNGLYTIAEADEREALPTPAERIEELEEALGMLLEGVTE